VLPVNVASWEGSSWEQMLLVGQEWDMMGCECLEIHVDLEVRLLANLFHCCSVSGKVKVLPGSHLTHGSREAETEMLVWGRFWLVYGRRGLCVLSNVPAEGGSYLRLAFGCAAIAGGPSSELGELFLPWLCERVRSDAGEKAELLGEGL